MIRRTHKLLTRSMLILSEADVKQCFPVNAAIECNRKALSSLRKNGDGGAVVPTRIGLPYNPGDASSPPSTDWSLFKPAAYYPLDNDKEHDIVMGMKVVSVRADNPSKGKPTVPATVVMLDSESGEVSTIMGATYLTAARTAAGSALATELALGSLQNEFVLVVFGAGLQAELHIKSIQHVVKIKEVIIVNRTLERAKNLKEDLESTNESNPISISTVILSDEEAVNNAVQKADIIATTTNTCVHLFDGKLVKPGCHVNGVGSFTPQMREVDDALVQRSEVLIDTPEAIDVGDLSWLKSKKDKVLNNTGLIGDALTDDSFKFGKLRDDPNMPHIDCTFFKSCGTAIQDVISAQYVSNLALTKGIGKNVQIRC